MEEAMEEDMEAMEEVMEEAMEALEETGDVRVDGANRGSLHYLPPLLEDPSTSMTISITKT